MVAALGGGALGALFRRLVGRRVRDRWGVSFQAVVGSTRGNWALMPRLGVVRWRNAVESMVPVQTDGLAPRFLRDEPSPPAIDGAWLEPPDAGDAVVLYFHGGGFAFGSLATHGPLIGPLARACKARTLALLYRLAPEHPSPAAVDDAVAAYRYLRAQGIAPGKIVLAGDSAGGNLVITTLLALRDAGEPLPAAGVAISPWVDLSNTGESFRTFADVDYVGLAQCSVAADAYLGERDRRDPRVSPLYADLAGLPPLLVHAGGAETLVDQIQEFAGRAKAAGVDVKLAVYDDMVHVWHLMHEFTPDGKRAIDEIGAFVRTVTAAPG